jgi:hypothetical protein
MHDITLPCVREFASGPRSIYDLKAALMCSNGMESSSEIGGMKLIHLVAPLSITDTTLLRCALQCSLCLIDRMLSRFETV